MYVVTAANRDQHAAIGRLAPVRSAPAPHLRRLNDQYPSFCAGPVRICFSADVSKADFEIVAPRNG